jgi:cyclohexa-1,5-dienecarbonyl-CoA hydratase
MNPEPSTIVLRRDGRTATVTIDRPPLNILDIPTMARLRGLVDQLAADSDGLNVLILRGAGERAFSAGVAVQDHTPDKVAAMLETLHGAIRGLREMDAITVAAVQGHCLGGGMELALACDLMVATENARFGQPEIELGCYPPVAAALYPSLLGAGRTLDLLLTGRTLSCAEAEQMGLVARRVPTGQLDQAVADLSAQISARSAPVVRLTKRAVRAGRDHGFAEALAETERIYLEELCQVEDMEEGLRAFVEKRPPVWKNR